MIESGPVGCSSRVPTVLSPIHSPNILPSMYALISCAAPYPLPTCTAFKNVILRLLAKLNLLFPLFSNQKYLLIIAYLFPVALRSDRSSSKSIIFYSVSLNNKRSLACQRPWYGFKSSNGYFAEQLTSFELRSEYSPIKLIHIYKWNLSFSEFFPKSQHQSNIYITNFARLQQNSPYPFSNL